MNDEKNLTGSDAVYKLRKLIESASTGMLATQLSEIPFHVCPMHVQQVDQAGDLWFFSGAASAHHAHILRDSRVQLVFSNVADYQFLTVYGEAEIVVDRAKINALWDVSVKAWFPEGKDDPNLCLIRVRPALAHYWDTKNGKMVTLVKMLAAAATGREPDAAVQGDLQV